MENYNKQFKNKYKKYIISRLIIGLSIIHKLGVLHCDIKPDNIVIDTSVTPYNPKYIDFGLSLIAEGRGEFNCPYTNNCYSGTLSFVLNDEINTGKMTGKSDVYALFKSFKLVFGKEFYDDITDIISFDNVIKILNQESTKIWYTYIKKIVPRIIETAAAVPPAAQRAASRLPRAPMERRQKQ